MIGILGNKISFSLSKNAAGRFDSWGKVVPKKWTSVELDTSKPKATIRIQGLEGAGEWGCSSGGQIMVQRAYFVPSSGKEPILERLYQDV